VLFRSLSNRTHTFVYSFDGKTWRWQNGQLLTKNGRDLPGLEKLLGK
jgi:hypothetical protein